MASVSTRKSGPSKARNQSAADSGPKARHRPVFDLWCFDTAGKRHRLRLGEIGTVAAREFREHTTALERSIKLGVSPGPELQAWLSRVDDRVYDRLAEWGLVQPRQAQTPKVLLPFVDWVIDLLSATRKSGTITTLRKTRVMLARYFIQPRPLSGLTPADADSFRAFLTRAKDAKPQPGAGLAEATARLHVRNLLWIVGFAVSHKHIHENPFEGLRRHSRSINGVRARYIPEAEALKVLDALPSNQHRLVFALARFSGLRIPSELSRLGWDQVDWAQKRLTIFSPKLRRWDKSDDQATRQVPIDPVVLGLLQDVYDAAAEGSVQVVTLGISNLDDTIKTATKRAGVATWARTFDTLRESCENQWLEEFPSHVVAAWMGHSVGTQQKHYAGVRDDHFDKAVRRADPRVAPRVAAAPGNDRQPAVNSDNCESATVGASNDGTQFDTGFSAVSDNLVGARAGSREEIMSPSL